MGVSRTLGAALPAAAPAPAALPGARHRHASALEDPEQVSPTYTPTAESVPHGLDAEQLHHYLNYCSEMLSLTAKTAALCAEHSTDAVVLETISDIETLTTELSNKIWQKISLLPG